MPAGAARFAAMLLAAPLLPLLPLVTAALWAQELEFGERHFRALDGLSRRLRPLGAHPAPTATLP